MSHLNILDLIVGGLLVVTGVILLKHLRKQPNAPRNRAMRVLCIVMMILGWMVVVADPVFDAIAANKR